MRKKIVAWSALTVSVLTITLVGGHEASGSPSRGNIGSAAATAPSVSQALKRESQAMADAAVASLRSDLNLSEAEARRRYAAQAGLDALGTRLIKRLGDRQAGAWIDPANGTLVVNVLDPEGARAVQSAGAKPRLVRHGYPELKHIAAELGREKIPPGISWGIDPQRDAVVVKVPPGRSFTTNRDYGDSVTVSTERTKASAATRPRTPAARTNVDGATAASDLYGGLAINMGKVGGSRCTSGFLATPVKSQGFDLKYLLTAGHCGDANTHVFRGDSEIGYISHSEYGPNDYAAIVLTNFDSWKPEPWVYTSFGPQPVNGGYTPGAVGSTVCMRGAATAYNCGRIVEFDISITKSSGTVLTGMDEVSLCATYGDSGAPVMVTNGAGMLAVGLIAGGPTTSRGTCQGVAYYEPLETALGKSLKLLTTG